MNINSTRFTFACYLYIYMGVAVFLLGWVKAIFGIPSLLLIGACLWKYRKEMRTDGSEQKLSVSPYMLLLIGVFALFFCMVSGQGAFFQQASDWDKHNRVLNDLVTYHWPVCYHNDTGEAMLTYYIGQYLVPALCGKLTSSFRVAEIALLLYNAAGIFGVVLLLIRVVKADTVKKQAVSILVFVFFGTCLFLGKALYGATGIGGSDISDLHDWISNSIQLQYRTIFVSSRWVFAQAIVPWMCTLLFMENYRNVRNYCLIGAPLLLYATFPFLGLGLLMLGVAAYRLFTDADKKRFAKEVFSPQNIAVAVTFFIPLVYMLGNVWEEKPQEVGFAYVNYGANTAVYVCFVATFLVYSAVIYKRYKTDLLFYLVNLSLLIFPFFRMGIYNDFTMSASIPAIFLLMVFVIQSLFCYGGTAAKKPGRLTALLVLLAAGAVYPAEELAEVLKAPVSFDGAWCASLEEWARTDGTIGMAEAYNYFTYDYEESLFYRYFSRRVSDEWKENIAYKLGEEARFDGSDQDAHIYFTKGISETDEDFAWLEGEETKLYAYIQEEVKGDLILRINLREIYDAPQRMVVAYEDEILFDESLEEGEDYAEIFVPSSCISEQMLNLSIQCPDAVSPQEMEEGEEEGEIVFAIDSFTLTYADE